MEYKRRLRSPRIILLILVSVCIWAAVPSCDRSSSSIVRRPDTLAKVRASKELHVGYFLFEPTIMEEKGEGTLKGVFIDMIEAIAKSLDAKVVYHKVDLANFAAGLQSGEFDLSIGATFATPQRATAVAFTAPLFYCGYTGIAKKGVASQHVKWQDLDRSDLRVAVKQGSAIDDFVRTNFHSAQVIRLVGPDLTLPLAAVSAGQADVGLMNQLTVFTYLREHPELEEVLAKTPVATTYFSWAVRQDDEIWLRFVNTCIDYHMNAGDFFYWTSKYGIPLMHRKSELEFPQMSYPEYWRLREPN